MVKIIDGKSIAKKIGEDVKHEILRLGRAPGFAAVLVGDDPASHLYVGLKEKACREAGIRFEKTLLAADAAEKYVLKKIAELNARDDVDAILIQLPLPAHLNEDKIIAAMDPKKDVDGFHPENLKSFLSGKPRITPALAAVIMTLIFSTKEKISGMRALVIANSKVFFAPLEKTLAAAGARPEFASPDDRDLSSKTKKADVLIVAAGRPKLITGEMLKVGCIVIDVGTNRVRGKIVGDVDFESASKTASHITPVPGGVGPVTVAMVLKNTVDLAKQNRS